MKKKNLLVIMMAAMLSVGLSSCSDDNEDGTVKVQYPIEITATNFPDANFRKCLLQSNYGKDGILTEDEIRDITQLIIWNEGICSLQGIEYFTALTSLDCGSNQLASLDVSKNTALALLNCSSNQLTVLDVSKNTALTWLNCSDNQLTSLDVSVCTELYELYCHINQIKEIFMDNLINSLPVKKNYGIFNVCSSRSSDEGNVCTKKQVKAAKEKGWIVYDNSINKEYEGSDDTSSVANDIRTEVGKDAPAYNLRGERLTAPQKGVNIIGGRKVVVK